MDNAFTHKGVHVMCEQKKLYYYCGQIINMLKSSGSLRCEIITFSFEYTDKGEAPKSYHDEKTSCLEKKKTNFETACSSLN